MKSDNRTLVSSHLSATSRDLDNPGYGDCGTINSLAARRKIMMRECAERGIQFHFVAAPDPTGGRH